MFVVPVCRPTFAPTLMPLTPLTIKVLVVTFAKASPTVKFVEINFNVLASLETVFALVL